MDIVRRTRDEWDAWLRAHTPRDGDTWAEGFARIRDGFVEMGQSLIDLIESAEFRLDVVDERKRHPLIVGFTVCGDVDIGDCVVECTCGKLRAAQRPHGYESPKR